MGNKKKESKICILFGAGADLDLGFSSGADFALNVIGRGGSSDGKLERPKMSAIDAAIKEYYEDAAKKDPWYSNYCSVKIKITDLLKASITKGLVSRQETPNSKKDFEDSINNEIARILKIKDWTTKEINGQLEDDKELKNQQTKKLSDAKNKINEAYQSIEKREEIGQEESGIIKDIECEINKNTSYLGVLDANFYTLLNPKKYGPNKFWIVVNCYTSAYLSLMFDVLHEEEGIDNSKETYLQMLKNPSEYIEKIKTVSKKKYEEDTSNSEKFLMYYGELRHFIEQEENKDRVRLITTNYTPACEAISKSDERNIAYIHGKLGWFESAKNNKVYDYTNKVREDDSSDEVLFPYLFIQSALKPIVDGKQIDELTKMRQFLKECNKLIIVGYEFSPDDNHIISVINDYIEDGKELCYIDYGNKYKNCANELPIIYTDKVICKSIESSTESKQQAREYFSQCLRETMKSN